MGGEGQDSGGGGQVEDEVVGSRQAAGGAGMGGWQACNEQTGEEMCRSDQEEEEKGEGQGLEERDEAKAGIGEGAGGSSLLPTHKARQCAAVPDPPDSLQHPPGMPRDPSCPGKSALKAAVVSKHVLVVPGGGREAVESEHEARGRGGGAGGGERGIEDGSPGGDETEVPEEDYACTGRECPSEAPPGSRAEAEVEVGMGIGLRMGYEGGEFVLGERVRVAGAGGD
ncbi:unnamed protein product, partial [Discosporangium mesarthrocarpum]